MTHFPQVSFMTKRPGRLAFEIIVTFGQRHKTAVWKMTKYYAMTQRKPTPRRKSGISGSTGGGGGLHSQPTRYSSASSLGSRGSRPSKGGAYNPYDARPSKGGARNSYGTRNPYGARNSSGAYTPSHGATGTGRGTSRPNGSRTRTTPRATQPSPLDQTVSFGPNGQVSLTRRQLIFGAAGLGAAAAIGVGATVLGGGESDSDIETLTVAEEDVFQIEDCEETAYNYSLGLMAEYTFKHGTQVWASCDNWAAALVPTDTPSPISTVGILNLNSGYLATVLSGPASEGNGWDIYDVRCNDSGIVWTECNCLTNQWRIYQTTQTDGTIGSPVLVEEGEEGWDVPFIAVAEKRAFWQVLPTATGPYNTQDSHLRSAAFGSSEVREDWTSHGRMSTPPYSTQDGIVITPRVDTSGVYHCLTYLRASDGKVLDTMTLPASMKPLEAGYVNGRFVFSFSAIYNYGGGIANLGTYCPASEGGQSGDTWFRFGRNPTAPPAWSGSSLIVKSTRSVSGVNLADRTMFVLPCPDDCDSFGEYLASTGTTDTIVTFYGMTTADDSWTAVRVWKNVEA